MLTERIDPNSAAVVRRILQVLADPSLLESPPPAEQAGSPDQESIPAQAVDDGLGRLLTLVVVAARGDGQAEQQARTILGQMQGAELPPELRQLGTALQRVLDGARGDEATEGLPEQLAQLIRSVLQNL